MTLNGHLMASWQRGRRRYVIEQQYRYRKWHPQSLLSHVMRKAVFQLSSCKDKEYVTSTAVNYFLAQVKSPGMEVAQGTNTYTLAMDLAATLRNVIEYLSRLTLLTLENKVPVNIPNIPGIAWSFMSPMDESGVLHRWKFVDYITHDAIIREMHSWQVLGDIVLGKAPMMLHLVSIGKTVKARRITPWCRAFASPAIANLYRFNRKSGEELKGDWKPVWFADNHKSNSKDWVDLMDSDNALEPLVQHLQVREPDEFHATNLLKDISYEYRQMVAAGINLESNQAKLDPMELPMCRTSCDVPYTCPHQIVCYSTKLTFENSGLYDTIPRNKVAK